MTNHPITTLAERAHAAREVRSANSSKRKALIYAAARNLTKGFTRAELEAYLIRHAVLPGIAVPSNLSTMLRDWVDAGYLATEPTGKTRQLRYLWVTPAMTVIPAWEYLSFSVTHSIAQLNAFGANGWEVVTHIGDQLLCKRPAGSFNRYSPVPEPDFGEGL